MSRARSNQKYERVSVAALAISYRAFEGTLMYMGDSIITQAAMLKSRMQQCLGDLRVKHLCEVNAYMI